MSIARFTVKPLDGWLIHVVRLTLLNQMNTQDVGVAERTVCMLIERAQSAADWCVCFSSAYSSETHYCRSGGRTALASSERSGVVKPI